MLSGVGPADEFTAGHQGADFATSTSGTHVCITSTDAGVDTNVGFATEIRTDGDDMKSRTNVDTGCKWMNDR